jgi:hypothetical protein
MREWARFALSGKFSVLEFWTYEAENNACNRDQY